MCVCRAAQGVTRNDFGCNVAFSNVFLRAYSHDKNEHILFLRIFYVEDAFLGSGIVLYESDSRPTTVLLLTYAMTIVLRFFSSIPE